MEWGLPAQTQLWNWSLKSDKMTQAHGNHKMGFIYTDQRLKLLKFIFNKKGIQEKMIYTFCYPDLSDNTPKAY